MDYQNFAQETVSSAMRAGAHEAEVFMQTGSEFSVDIRMGDIETLTQASYKGLGLRVFVNNRVAFASTTDFHPDVVDELVKNTVELAQVASDDPANGLPAVGPGPLPHLDLVDPHVQHLPAEDKIGMARDAERAAFDYDARITNSHGAGFGSHTSTRIIANSNGILYANAATDCGISCAPIAEQGTERQVGSYWTAKRYLRDLESPKVVGEEAALRAVRKLGARKVETKKEPVIFDWSMGSTLWGAVFSALEGETVHRGMSFLKDMLGKKIASDVVTLTDDPLMPGGLGSMPFDGEGVLTKRKTVVDKGVLNLYFYDARTARKYGQEPTGNARRGYSSIPSVGPANFYLEPCGASVADLVGEVSDGLYVMDTMGHGVNVVTGDFSVGASGMWISGGEFAFPVQEVTIAGNMLDMLGNIDAVAEDIKFISSIVTPTFRIAEMTVSGR
jgi:PmbA protein